MSATLRDKLLYYRDKGATAFEKEVIELVLESSQSYSDIRNFIKHLNEHDLDSGIVPKLTSPSFCIEFTDRHYMVIEELLVAYEKEHGKAFSFGSDKLMKVSLAYFGFTAAFTTILSKLESVVVINVKEDPRIERRKKINEQIHFFTGTETWHRLFPNVLATDGIMFVMETASAFWISNTVFAIQLLPEVQAEPFQFYELTVDLEHYTGKLVVTDGNENVIYTEELPYTDFPLAKFSFYYTDSVILLKSEY